MIYDFVLHQNERRVFDLNNGEVLLELGISNRR